MKYILIFSLILLNGSVIFLSVFDSVYFLLLFIPYSFINFIVILIIKEYFKKTLK
jgi:hypothetical protein